MDSGKDWHTTNLSSFNKGQILHLAQGSLYVRDELSYVFAGIVPFYIHFPQRSVTKIDIMSKFRIFSSKWHIFYLNKHLQFRIFVPKWRLWNFATSTAVELPNSWASLIFFHISWIYFLSNSNFRWFHCNLREKIWNLIPHTWYLLLMRTEL